MAPVVTFAVLLSVFYTVSLQNTVSGDCQFPAIYMNRFWFRMYVSSDFQKYTYRQFSTNAVIDNRNDITTLQQSYPCWNISFDSIDANTLYYLVDNYGQPTCAKSVITNDSSALLLHEAFVSNAYTDASQCRSVFTANCTNCDSLWMPVVNQLTQPPPFGSSRCPVQGLFHLMTASIAGNSSVCSWNIQSTATFSDSTVQMDLCSEGTLRNATFRTKTLLQDSLTCMASLGGRALNSEETGSTIVLLRDDNVLYCARFKYLSGGILELLINVKSSAYYAGCSFATNTTSVLQLLLSPMTNTPGLSTTTTTFTTTFPTTVLPTKPLTPLLSTTTLSTTTTSTSTTSTTTTSTTATTTTNTTTPSTTTTSTPIASTTTQVTPGISSPTSVAIFTTKGTSEGPPENVEGPTDDCPSTACATGAVCNQATHTCRCQSLFYTYINSSTCVQDDRAIDDAFLKIVVPIIAVAAAASLIAALVLCFATRPLDAVLAESTGAAMVVASTDNGVLAVQPATQLPEKPIFVSYGRNDTYAKADTVDRSLIVYGDQPAATPNNFVMVGSSIPVKM